VYEIEILDDKTVRYVDPIIEIAHSLPGVLQSPTYRHDGSQAFLLGVVDPVKNLNDLQQPCVFPPGTAGTPRAANLSLELEALVRALRDSEVMINGNVPASLVRNRYSVY
jgi:hypothetical protein